jgi:pimeloyl-ACP methyl ester carboxylesterase
MSFRGVSALLCVTAFAAIAPGQTDRIRVACIGDEFAAGRTPRDGYPAMLQKVLGKKYDIRTFTKAGTTLSAQGDRPYAQQAEYKRALEYLPQIVIVGTGMNDSKARNRAGIPGLGAGCATLVRSFQSLRSRPRVLLLLPSPLSAGDPAGVSHAVIRDQVVPALRSTAFTSGCEIVNLYNHMIDRPAYFSDSTRVSPEGSHAVALLLRDIVKTAADADFNLPARADVSGDTTGHHGYACLRFNFEGREARIVRPKRTARGRPWLWRARFWGHEPQTEIALLERGFHIVYCDVAELFGNDQAVGIWNRFYALMVQAGMSEQAALEGFSRGGLYVYRWAVANPRRVLCIYADAPVLDFKSWPGGKGKGHGNPEEWTRFKQDFGLASEEEAMAFRGNPIDMAPQIAAGGYPMLHVCGDADETVPVEENTNIFERRVLDSGGSITVIHKPGVGHHPHSLANPQPIVEFILRAAHLLHQ